MSSDVTACSCDEMTKKFLVRPILVSFMCPKHGLISLDSRSIPAPQNYIEKSEQHKKFIAPSTVR
jgi:hypothetical protein